MRSFKTGVLAVMFISGVATAALANVDELKAYRQAYPDLKPGCAYCHVDAMPKKDAGKHDLNAYGTKAHEMRLKETKEMTKEELTALYVKIFTELGRHDAAGADQ